MPADILKRYMWLFDVLLNRGPITLKDIQSLWEKSPNNDDHSDLPVRTFHNHKNAVEEIFKVSVKCQRRGGYKYYIDDQDKFLEKSKISTWMMDSFSTISQMQSSPDSRLEDRIRFEDIPSGRKYLQQIISAMKVNKVLEIEHRGFARPESKFLEIEPYALKLFRRRWYVIARDPKISEVRTYGLDRIKNLKVTDKDFSFPNDFNIDDYFSGCIGVFNIHGLEMVDVEIKADKETASYIESLPIHSSQTMIASNNLFSTFRYKLKPTYDFKQVILSFGSRVEVLKPDELRQEIYEIAQNIVNKYKK